jgi:hypothetical protein
MRLLTLLSLTCIAAAPLLHAQSGALPVRYKAINDKQKRLEIEAKYPAFGGQTPLAKLANRTLEARVLKEVRMVRARLKEDWSQKDFTPPAPYSLSIHPEVSVATPGLISLQLGCFAYLGGAHGAAWMPTYNFAIVNGKAKQLALQDLFQRKEDAIDTVSKLVIPKLREQGASSVVDGSLKKLTKEQANNFVVTKRGLEFIFEPYSVGSWAEGQRAVEIPFASLAAHLDKNGPLRSMLPRAK